VQKHGDTIAGRNVEIVVGELHNVEFDQFEKVKNPLRSGSKSFGFPDPRRGEGE
jgi:hypothetical protein